MAQPLTNVVVLGPNQAAKQPAAYALAQQLGLQYLNLDYTIQLVLATPDERKSPMMLRVAQLLKMGKTVTLNVLLRVVRSFGKAERSLARRSLFAPGFHDSEATCSARCAKP